MRTNSYIPKFTYNEWMQSGGKYRWYHEDGTPRVYTNLDYAWKDLYDKVTHDCDMRYQNWEIDPDEIDYFTREFLYRVPGVWLRFKTSAEMLLGTLDGKNINPDEFKAGYERIVIEARARDEQGSVNTKGSSAHGFNTDRKGNNTNEAAVDSHKEDWNEDAAADKHTTDNTIDARDDEAKARQINYVQGAQAQNSLSNGNIGSLGNTYASNVTDSIANNTKGKEHSKNIVDDNIGERGGNRNWTDNIGKRQGSYTDNETGTEQTDTAGKQESKNKVNEGMTQKVKETRINFYDQLAFLRTRLELDDKIYVFAKGFEDLFYDVISLKQIF